MGFSVSRHSEPGRKLNLLEKRIGNLRAVIKHTGNSAKIAIAAEKVRFAVFAVIKAKSALINEYPVRDPDGKHLLNLLDEVEQWVAFTIDEIVQETCKS